MEDLNHYLVKIHHTAEEKMEVLDELNAHARKLLPYFNFAVEGNDPIAYAIFKRRTEQEVQNLLPESLRKKAIIIKVENFTSEQVAEIHAGMVEGGYLGVNGN